MATIDAPQDTTRTFDVSLKERLNSLSQPQSLHGQDIFPLYRPPSKYTGELFGVEYLFWQSGIVLKTQGEELDKRIDEGFEDIDDWEDLNYSTLHDHSTVACPVEESDSDEDETEVSFLASYILPH